jgi:CheY-like chemotaxis protein
LAARILLTEDNPVNQEVAHFMLQKFGCSVDIANNGKEALQAVGEKTYDLVLMDCMMPEMDGYAATAEIRRRQAGGRLPYFPIIALTANAIEGDREKCLVAGMDDYLSKPFNADSLLRVIKPWLKNAVLSNNQTPLTSAAITPIDPAINSTTLDSIRALDAGGGNALLQRIVGLYLSNADSLLKSLQQGFDQGELGAIRTAAHTLKSSSNQVGAHKLADLCREVENEARSQRYDASGDILSRIQQEFSHASRELQAIIT